MSTFCYKYFTSFHSVIRISYNLAKILWQIKSYISKETGVRVQGRETFQVRRRRSPLEIVTSSRTVYCAALSKYPRKILVFEKSNWNATTWPVLHKVFETDDYSKSSRNIIRECCVAQVLLWAVANPFKRHVCVCVYSESWQSGEINQSVRLLGIRRKLVIFEIRTTCDKVRSRKRRRVCIGARQ